MTDSHKKLFINKWHKVFLLIFLFFLFFIPFSSEAYHKINEVGTEEGVYLCLAENFGGPCLYLSEGEEIANLDCDAGDFNDEVSSIKIIGNYEIQAYRHDNFVGDENHAYICFNSSVQNLGQYYWSPARISTESWNDQISSVQILNSGSCLDPGVSHGEESDASIGDVLGAIANIATYILTLPARVVMFWVALGLFLIALILGFLFFLFASLLKWIMASILTIGITPLGDAPGIVTEGWEITRDFANMFFIVILVFIGLATILKLKDYEAKKALPLLILIALLINFSPTMVGFVVDIGNVFTHFFFTHTKIASIGNVWDLSWNYFSTSVAYLFTTLGNPITVFATFVGIGVYGTVLVVFYGFAFWVYFIISILLFARVAILWTLMILAPMAFASYILPPTRKLWSKWWQELINWTIIGIPLGFFLYISSEMMSSMTAQNVFGDAPSFSDISEMEGFTGAISNLVTNIIGPSLALIFLYIGYKLSRQFAPAAANQIIEGTKKAIKTVAKIGVAAATAGAGLAAGAAAGGATAAAGGRIAASGASVARFSGKMGKFGKPLKLFGKTMQKTGEGVEGLGKRWKVKSEGSISRKIEDQGEEIVKRRLTTEELAQRLKDADRPELPDSWRMTRRAPIVSALLETGKWNEAVERGLIREDKEEVKEMGRETAKWMWDKGVKNPARWMADTELVKMIYPTEWKSSEDKLKEAKKEMQEAERLERQGSQEGVTEKLQKASSLELEGNKFKEDLVGKLLGRIKSDDIAHMSEDSLKDNLVKSYVVHNFDGNKLGQIARNFGKDVVEGIQQEIEKEGPRLARTNPSAFFWLFGNTAQDLGFAPPQELAGLSRRETRSLVANARILSRGNKEEKKRKVRAEYEGKEELMFKDYYQKETAPEIKDLIKEIVSEGGKTIPSEVKVKELIKNFEDNIKKLDEEIEKLKREKEIAKKRFNDVKTAPMASERDREELRSAREIMRKTQRKFESESSKLKEEKENLLTEEKRKLKDLW